MPALPFRLLSHTADIGLEITAPTWTSLLEETGRGWTALVTDPARVTAQEQQTLSVAADGRDLMLADFLRELLYRFDARGWLAAEYRVTEAPGGGVLAELSGETWDPARHPLRQAVKAVTWHRLEVAEQDGEGGREWVARVYFDV